MKKGQSSGKLKGKNKKPAQVSIVAAAAGEILVMLQRQVGLLESIHDALKGSAERDKQHEKLALIQKHNDFLRETCELAGKQLQVLESVRDGQKTLSEVLALMTAKGISKPREKKEAAPTAGALVAATNQDGKDIAAEQRAETAAALLKDLNAAAAALPLVTTPKPDLKIVPPTVVAPSSAVPTADEVRSLFLAFVAKNTREKGIDLLKSFGANKVSEVPPSQLSRFAEACR